MTRPLPKHKAQAAEDHAAGLSYSSAAPRDLIVDVEE